MLAQTHPDIEYIVIDGASNDGTSKLLEEYGVRIAKIVSERDSGIYNAMNKGLALATGDYVGFLNADDQFSSPDVIADVVEGLSRTKADLLYGNLVYVDKDRPSRVVRLWRSGEFYRSRLFFGWMPPHPTFYVRRTLQHSLGYFNEELRISADYDFMLRCLVHPGVCWLYLDKRMVDMRTGGASNRSLRAIMIKSREDLQVLRTNRIGGVLTLICKNFRKVPQFLLRAGKSAG